MAARNRAPRSQLSVPYDDYPIPDALKDEPRRREHGSEPDRERPRSPGRAEAPMERQNGRETRDQNRGCAPLLEVDDRSEPCGERPEEKLRGSDGEKGPQGRRTTRDPASQGATEERCHQGCEQEGRYREDIETRNVLSLRRHRREHGRRSETSREKSASRRISGSPHGGGTRLPTAREPPGVSPAGRLRARAHQSNAGDGPDASDGLSGASVLASPWETRPATQRANR